MIELERLKALEAKATGGPWSHCYAEIDNGREVIGDFMASDNEDEDAILVAESRNALPEILAWIERARPLIETIETAEESQIGSDACYPVDFDEDDKAEAAALLGELEY